MDDSPFCNSVDDTSTDLCSHSWSFIVSCFHCDIGLLNTVYISKNQHDDPVFDSGGAFHERDISASALPYEFYNGANEPFKD